MGLKSMSFGMRLAGVPLLFSALSFAGSWSGTLVDAGCYAARERNVNPTDTLTSVDRDKNNEIRYCSPTAKTRIFAVVAPDGQLFAIDSAGNAKAAELVRASGKNSQFKVIVSGVLDKNTIKVDSISTAESNPR